MAYNTILLKGDAIFKEAPAAGAITPGHLVIRNSSGNMIVNATAGANTGKLFARENELLGKDIADAYASGDECLFFIPQPGSEVYALVAAAASAIVINDSLEAAADGTLRKLTSGTPLAKALEAVDNSGGGSPARIVVEIL